MFNNGSALYHGAFTPLIMPAKYKQLIGDYCTQNGIDVPPGFARHAASRYAIVRIHLTPPKLIAKTWLKTADVIYYLEHFLLPELGDELAQSIRILDFQEGEELSYAGGKQLVKAGRLSMAPEKEED